MRRYDDAIRLLHHGSWTAKHGFEGIGTPRAIGANRSLMEPLVEMIAAGSGASLFKVCEDRRVGRAGC